MEAHIRVRLRQADERMARTYRSAKGHMDYDLRFTFRAGDQVLLRQRRPGKTKPHVEGPFTFLRYTRSLGVTAVIQAPSGAEMEVSIANLLPLRTGSWGPVEMFDSDASSDDVDE